MEKIKKIKKTLDKQITEENIEIPKKEVISDPIINIWGWSNENEVAESVWCSIHNILINGNLVFAYRSAGFGSKSDLAQIVVTRSIENPREFAVGVMTKGYSMLLPHVPFEYLKGDLYEDLSTNWKLDKKICQNYTNIIKLLENEITGN